MGLFGWLMGEEPNPISQVLNYENKGQFGEYLTEYILSKVKGYNHILQNLYIPISNNRTTEIDLVMIHKKGIFVFESKNYSGWIFGSIDQKQWTQCLPNKEKYRFYNPIMQNRTHINALQKITGVDNEAFFSFIIFSKRCELKKVPERSAEFEILKRDELKYRLENIIESSDKKEIFSAEQLDLLKNKLIPYTNVSEEIKRKHIEDINKAHKNF